MRGMWIVAGKTAFLDYRKMWVPRDLQRSANILVARNAEFLWGLSDKFGIPGRMRLVTDDTSAHSDRPMHILLPEILLSGVASKAETGGGIIPELIAVITSMGIVAS